MGSFDLNDRPSSIPDPWTRRGRPEEAPRELPEEEEKAEENKDEEKEEETKEEEGFFSEKHKPGMAGRILSTLLGIPILLLGVVILVLGWKALVNPPDMGIHEILEWYGWPVMGLSGGLVIAFLGLFLIARGVLPYQKKRNATLVRGTRKLVLYGFSAVLVALTLFSMVTTLYMLTKGEGYLAKEAFNSAFICAVLTVMTMLMWGEWPPW